MAITTIRGLNKVAAREFLESKGYVAFRCFSKSVRLYSLLMMACNKLNPQDPWKAFSYLSHELHRLTQQKSTRVAVHARKKEARVDLLRRELAMMTNDSVCPCCGSNWDQEGIIPQVGDHIALPPHKS